MTSNCPFTQLTQKVCQAGARGDSTQVSRLLGHNRGIASQIDAGLLAPSNTCKELLQRLSSDDTVPQCNAEHALRAMMIIPPCYETPWRAIVKLIECLHLQSGWLGSSPNALFAGIADAQTFLQQTISSWWRQESNVVGNQQPGGSLESTPREWLLRIAQVAMKPLQDDSVAVARSDNRHWVLPLDVVATIICYCQELEGPTSATRTTILDQLFSETVLKVRMLPLLSLARDLKSQLREVDRQRLHTLLQASLTSNQIPSSDLPGVARSIISFSDQDKEWKQHLLHILHASSRDLSTYSTVETVIQSSLSAQSTQILYEWHSVKPTESLQKWILANYYLLLFSSARQSGSQLVSRLLSRALGKDDKAFNVLEICSQSLVRLCLPSATTKRRDFDTASLQRLFDGVSYAGEGKFLRKKQPMKELEITVLSQSLYLGLTKFENRKQRLSAAERAQAWIHAATFLLSKPNFADKVTAVLVIVAVFCEVPASRSTLIRSMVGDEKSLKNEDCIIIGLLVRSLKSKSDLEALEPICTYYSSKNLSFDVFTQLADAFASVTSGRDALLSVCQKKLHASNAPWWDAIENRGSAERQDMLKSSLYGLCVLLVEWNDVGWSAWKLLSDFLVLNKPSLPLIVRSWLYRTLLSFIRNDRFSDVTMQHLLHALFTRLLTYFDWTRGTIKFVPQRAVASFVASAEPMLKEDLSLLFGLVTDLTLKVCNWVSFVDLELCRLKLQSISSNPMHALFEVGSEPHYHRIMSALLASSFLFVFGKASRTQTAALSTSISSCRSKFIKDLAEHERDAYNEGGFSAIDRLPEWLSCSANSKACGKNVELPKYLCCSLCDLVIAFLSKQFTPLSSDSRAALVMSLSNIYAARRKFYSPSQIGAFDMPVGTHSIAVATVCMFSETVSGMIVDEQTRLEDLHAVIIGLESVCDAITSQARSAMDYEERSDDMAALLDAVALLHREVTSERPTVKLFQFLQNACSERAPTAQDVEGIMTIRSSEDADIVVLEFRSKIMRALVACINALSKGRMFEIVYTDGIFGQTDQNHETEGDKVAILASEMMEFTTNDFLQGMTEHSGGLLDSVYDLYLEIVEALSNLFIRLLPISGEWCLLADATNAALRRMSEVLCKFPNEMASLFKRTMHMAIVVLPSLRRVVLRHSSTDTLQIENPGAALFDSLAKQILNIVERKANGESIAWTDSPGTPKEDGEDECETEESADVPLEIYITADALYRSPQHNREENILTSEARFSYASRALLTAIDIEFSESVVVLQQKVPFSQDSDRFDLEIGIVVHRQEGLHRCMKVVSCCLQYATKDFEVSNESRKVLAQEFPIASKVKFLVGLDKLILMLVRSLRLLIIYFKRGRYSSATLAEIICIVVAWVSDENMDIIAGSRRWFHAEKVSGKTSKAAQRGVDKILSRLPKTMSRIDELENMLQRLVDAGISSRAKDSAQGKRYQMVEDAMRQSIVTEVVRREFSLEKGTKSRLDSALTSREYGNDLVHPSVGRKRKAQQDIIAKRMRRERTRPIPRSRNQVVDQWLQVDQDCVDEDDDDAYVDLEDFLVDG